MINNTQIMIQKNDDGFESFSTLIQGDKEQLKELLISAATVSSVFVFAIFHAASDPRFKDLIEIRTKQLIEDSKK